MARGVWGLRPAGRFQHLRDPPHSHTAVKFPEQKNLSHNQKDPTPQLGKPKPTRSLEVGRHGDRETQPLPSPKPERKASGVAWTGRRRGRGWGTVPPRKPLLSKAALSLGHLNRPTATAWE